MNRSGQVVATAAGFYKVELSGLLVVSDDMAIEPGRIRLRTKGSSGGQKGLDDIIVKLGSNEFNRLRIGIGQSGQQEGYDYVLGKPRPEEKDLIDDAIERAKQAVICWIVNGIDIAMNEYNCDVVD
jgi:PTH1 family peptidyl-tRNA hydrolase